MKGREEEQLKLETWKSAERRKMPRKSARLVILWRRTELPPIGILDFPFPSCRNFFSSVLFGTSNCHRHPSWISSLLLYYCYLPRFHWRWPPTVSLPSLYRTPITLRTLLSAKTSKILSMLYAVHTWLVFIMILWLAYWLPFGVRVAL